MNAPLTYLDKDDLKKFNASIKAKLALIIEKTDGVELSKMKTSLRRFIVELHWIFSQMAEPHDLSDTKINLLVEMAQKQSNRIKEIVPINELRSYMLSETEDEADQDEFDF